jgi:hypothetical protein
MRRERCRTHFRMTPSGEIDNSHDAVMRHSSMNCPIAEVFVNCDENPLFGMSGG